MSTTFPSPQYVPYRPPPPKRSNWWIWLIVALIPLCLLLGVALLVGLGALFVLTAKEEPPTDEERGLMVDAAAVAGLTGDFDPRPEFERLKKSRYLDGSHDIEYEYDGPSDDAPYIQCTLTVERSLSDARTSYLATWGGAKIGPMISGEKNVAVVEQSDHFRWGDESRMAILQLDGQPVGNIFVARKGMKVFHVSIAGACFEDRQSFADLVEPVLERVERYKP